ncbi:hypothetical protein ACNTMW_24700 [Planosporangium sp. 12N6]|uniref:hypothetical protein n=1 Tax=Planosporangium spinosum TaxID=3402278 RepID=UPI003CF6F3FE
MYHAITVLVGLVGAVVILLTAVSAAQTFVVPRGTPLLITRMVLVTIRAVFRAILRHLPDYRSRDHVLAMFAPACLLMIPIVWIVLVLIGFTAVYRAEGVRSWTDAFLESGSSLFMLGFRNPFNLPSSMTEMVEAGFGLGLIALLIAYLPSIYASYSRRELLVTALEIEAGSPPSAVALLVRLIHLDGLSLLDQFWRDWSRWFNDIEETHTATPILVFFRSPAPERNWVTAAGAVLDSAALVASTIEVDKSRQAGAELCVRAGYVALHRIGDYFVMPYDPAPPPGQPIAVTRGEYDEACRLLATAGAPLRADRDQSWREFVRRRASYEGALLRFASLCMAPRAPWSSDRPIEFHRLPVARHRARARLHRPRRYELRLHARDREAAGSPRTRT